MHTHCSVENWKGKEEEEEEKRERWERQAANYSTRHISELHTEKGTKRPPPPIHTRGLQGTVM